MKWKYIVAVLFGIAAVFALKANAQRGQGKDTIVRTIKIDDSTRTYHLHIPPHLPTNQKLPIVFMFHGGGGTAAHAERESKFSDLADKEGFLVVYPAGIGKGWNDGRGVDAIAAQRNDVDDVAFISDVIDTLSTEFSVDDKRIYATGISNGAIFSHYLAAKLSTKIAAIAPVVGGMPVSLSTNFAPQSKVSVLIIQGTMDPLIPYDGGYVTPPGVGKRGEIISTDLAVQKWVTSNGCSTKAVEEALEDKSPSDGCRVTKMNYGNGKNGTEVCLYRIIGGGHTWPNGTQYLPQVVVGKCCRDFDGTSVIWEFFKSHPKVD